MKGSEIDPDGDRNGMALVKIQPEAVEVLFWRTNSRREKSGEAIWMPVESDRPSWIDRSEEMRGVV
jgi:hypothetical protein